MNQPKPTMQNALVSVSDKTGLDRLGKACDLMGIRILSTGGTAKTLSAIGIPVTEVADYTGFPEMLDGRLKTLHPKIHGGLLARRDLSAHMDAIREAEIEPIDLVVVNLYPFAQTVAKPSCTLEDAIENIDIGGPTMLRAAAKNWRAVTVVVDPNDYGFVMEGIRLNGCLPPSVRYKLACKAYRHTGNYDVAIANWLESTGMTLADRQFGHI